MSRTIGAARKNVSLSLQRALLGGASAVMLVGGCGGSDGAAQPQRAVTTAPATQTATTSRTPEPMPKVVLSVRRPPRTISGDDVLVAGIVTRGASVTVRGREADVRRGRFRIRLKLRVGVNRFTVVARRDGHQTARRPLRIRRRPPPPPPLVPPPLVPPPVVAPPALPPAAPDTNGPNDPCPPGTNYVEPDGCVGGDY